MTDVVQCPCTLSVHFPPTVYRSAGSAQVLPDLVKSLDIANVQCIQFVPNGIVRVTFKESAQCDAALAGGVSFRGSNLRVTPVDARTRLVYLRDLPAEVPDEPVKVFLRKFGVLHSLSPQFHPGLPDVKNGTRVAKVTLVKDLPSSVHIAGFDARLWYQGQPQSCPVCRQFGHRVRDCPLNGLCRRCRQPGHMARECSSRRPSLVPDVSLPVDPTVSEDEADPDYVLSSASESASCSGDEEVLRSAPTSVAGARKRSAPPPVPSDSAESSVDLRDNELSPPSESASAVPDPASVPASVPGMPESASAVVVPDGTPVSASAVKPKSSVPPPDGTPVSASAVKPESSVPPPATSSGSKPRKKKPRSSRTAKSTPVEPTPAARKEPPLPTYWEATHRSGFGYFVEDCTGDVVFFDYGRFSHSIEIDSTSFEYDRFVKFVHHNVNRPYLCDYVKASSRAPRTTYLQPGTPLEFPKPPK